MVEIVKRPVSNGAPQGWAEQKTQGWAEVGPRTSYTAASHKYFGFMIHSQSTIGRVGAEATQKVSACPVLQLAQREREREREEGERGREGTPEFS